MTTKCCKINQFFYDINQDMCNDSIFMDIQKKKKEEEQKKRGKLQCASLDFIVFGRMNIWIFCF